MAVNNTLQRQQQKQPMTMTAYLNSEAVKQQITDVVGKNSQTFIASIITATTVNPTLAKCTKQSVLSAGLLAESLALSLSPQLGYAYIVPYEDRKNDAWVAQFQLGYRGYIQLAIRSGLYKSINVLAIKEGELEYFDPLNEEIKVHLMIDKWDEREEMPTIGYFATFELLNGFRKSIYWSKKQMLRHADKYVPSFSWHESDFYVQKEWKHKVSYEDFKAGNYPKGDKWMYSSPWYSDFDGMAYKTMLRQLISKWGIMSLEMQTAFSRDDTYMDQQGNPRYIDDDEFAMADPAGQVEQPAEAPTTPTAPEQIETREPVQQPTFVQPDPVPQEDIGAALFGA